jgi:hypothetical protein
LDLRFRKVEEEKASVQVTMMKHEESSRDLLSSLKQELSAMKEENHRLLLEKSKVEEELQRKLETTVWSMDNQRRRDLELIMADLQENHRTEMAKSAEELSQLQRSLQSMNAAIDRKSDDEKSLRFTIEKQKAAMDKKDNELAFALEGKSQLQAVNRDLESVIVDQKREMEKVTASLKSTIDGQMKRMVDLQEKLKRAQSNKSGDGLQLKKQLKDYQRQLLDKDEEIFRLQRNLKIIQEDLKEKVLIFRFSPIFHFGYEY